MSELNITNLFFENIEEQFDLTISKVAKEFGFSVDELFEKAEAKGENIITDFDDSLVEGKLNSITFSLKNFIRTHLKNQETIVFRNSESFKFFIIYINCVHIIYEKSVSEVDKIKPSENLKLCISLYGIITRKSEQIVTLLIDGQIDAAMIIWRSLYENIIAILVLLAEKSDTLAKKFFNHSIKNSKKKIVSYTNNYEDLKFNPPPEGITEDLEQEEKRVKEMYGNDFTKNEFGWADDLFPDKQKANLRLLEEKVNFKKYRPYYLLCSEHTHLGFNVFRNYTEENRIILPRILSQETELKSFIDPMQFTLSILHELNNQYLFYVSVKHECDLNAKFLYRIFEELLNTFPENENGSS